jgi:hypothetical protein
MQSRRQSGRASDPRALGQLPSLIFQFVGRIFAWKDNYPPNSTKSAFASFISAVSKPSVNRP